MFGLLDKEWSEGPIKREKEIIKNNNSKSISFNSLEDLEEYVKNFELCPSLKVGSTNTVFGNGPKDSPLLVIGEAPGFKEDLMGIPFVGDSGQLFNRMLNEVGIDRNKIYVSNMVYWRPEKNRAPNIKEIEICLPIVKEMIRIKKPSYILLLGSTALKGLLGDNYQITKVRGSLLYYIDGDINIPVIATFHPSYILRDDRQKVYFLEDLKKIKDEMEKNNLLDLISLKGKF